MARTAYHHGDLQQQVHDQALAVVREHGDSAISLRALAKQIGVSAPALYRHFADRESLLAELAIDCASLAPRCFPGISVPSILRSPKTCHARTASEPFEIRFF